MPVGSWRVRAKWRRAAILPGSGEHSKWDCLTRGSDREMTGHRAQVDAVIIGGGPAGATAAALLAEWGRSAVVVHHDAGHPSLAESLPWSIRKLLRHLGQIDAVDAAGFHPNSGNISRWAGREARAVTDGRGYHVSRRHFDRVLRDHARAKGASIVEGSVNRVDLSSMP